MVCGLCKNDRGVSLVAYTGTLSTILPKYGVVYSCDKCFEVASRIHEKDVEIFESWISNKIGYLANDIICALRKDSGLEESLIEENLDIFISTMETHIEKLEKFLCWIEDNKKINILKEFEKFSES